MITLMCSLKCSLKKITWPVEDSDDEDFDIESTCRVTGFLRIVIEGGINTLFGICIDLFTKLSLKERYDQLKFN